MVLKSTTSDTPAKSRQTSKPAKKAIVKKTVAEIERIATHTNPHTDEVFGIWYLRKFGEYHFPGIHSAKIIFLNKDPELSDKEYDAVKILPIGIGKGRFDEHKFSGPRKHSATSLIVRFIANKDKAALLLATEIHRCDIKSGVRDTQLAEIVKTVHRTKNNGSATILKWLLPTFDVLYEQLRFHYDIADNEVGVTGFFDKIVESKWYEGVEERTLNSIRRRLQKSEEITRNCRSSTSESTYTEIDYIVRSMQRVGKTPDEIYNWLHFVISCMIDDRKQFVETLIALRNKEVRFGAGDGLRACFIQGANPTSLRAANHKRYDVIALRNSIGQHQIFLGSDVKDKNLDVMISVIRWLELSPEDKKKVRFEDLAVAGEHELVKHWYYDPEHRCIFNGSQSRPGVPPSLIQPSIMRKIVANSFNEEHIRRMKEYFGIESTNAPYISPEVEALAVA